MPDFRKLTELARKWLGNDAKLKLIVLLGALGVLLIVISQFMTGKKAQAPPPMEPSSQTVFTAEAYCRQLEDRLSSLISRVEGVGQAEVLITLEDSGESIYVLEETRKLDRNVEPTPDARGEKIDSSENIQQKYILVETGYGQKEPLLRTTREPKIQGVVIICAGAGNIYVKQSLISIITTALHIPSTRVCVEKFAEQP